jgi:hypothetical protein
LTSETNQRTVPIYSNQRGIRNESFECVPKGRMMSLPPGAYFTPMCAQLSTQSIPKSCVSGVNYAHMTMGAEDDIFNSPEMMEDCDDDSEECAPKSPPKKQKLDPSDKLTNIIKLLSANGSWNWTKELEDILEKSFAEIQNLVKDERLASKVQDVMFERLVSTSYILQLFQEEFSNYKSVWQMAAKKAQKFLQKHI